MLQRDDSDCESPARPGAPLHSEPLRPGRTLPAPTEPNPPAKLTRQDHARIELAMPMVERHAKLVAKRWPKAHRDELLAVGYMALVESALRFDPALGRFEAFAFKRVRGAMSVAVTDVAYSKAPLLKAANPFPALRVGDESEPGNEDLVELITRKACVSELQERVAALPDGPRSFVHEVYYRDATVEAAATRLGISRATAHRWHRNARVTLACHLRRWM